MREIISLTAPTSGAALRCPPGRQLRLLSVTADADGLTTGDQALVTVGPSSEVLARAATAQLTADPTGICFAIGAALTEPRLAAIDPVTGIATYTGAGNVTAPLPDIQWQTDVNVVVVAGNATQCVLVYELTKQPD